MSSVEGLPVNELLSGQRCFEWAKASCDVAVKEVVRDYRFLICMSVLLCLIVLFQAWLLWKRRSDEGKKGKSVCGVRDGFVGEDEAGKVL